MKSPVYWQGESMLLGWSETSTRGRTVTLLLPEDDDQHPFKDATVKNGKHAGQRFAVVFVQIGEDEKPVEQTLRTSAQAAILCRDPAFWRFADERSFGTVDSENAARDWMCSGAGVKSRAEFDTNKAAAHWFQTQCWGPFQQHREALEERVI